jgi:hypothetical protein
MAATFVSSAPHTTTNPTTSCATTIPTVQVNDLLVLYVTNGGATAAPTVTDNDSGTWTKKTASATVKGTLWWRRATAATSAKSVTAAGLTNSSSSTLFVIRGAITSGDPFHQYSEEENIAGNETHAGITTTVAGCYVGFGIANGASNGDSAGVATVAGATIGSLSNFQNAVSTGGVDCANSQAGVAQAAAGATGAITWAQADLATSSALYAITPQPATQDLTPTAYTDADTFFTQVIGVGVVNLSPTLFGASQTFYTQVVDQPIATQDLTPSLFADGETFYTQTIGVGAVDLSPTLYADDDTFYTQTVAVGAVDLAPSLFTNSNTFFTQVVEQVAQDLTPDLFADDDTFYTQTVSVGAVDLAPSLFEDGETFYTQTVGVGAVDLAPSLFEDADTFYTQTVTVVEPQALEPDLFANDNTFHSSTLSVGAAPASGAVRGPGRRRKSSRRLEEHTPRITEEFIAELRQAREAREAAERAKEAAERREPKQVRTEANKTAALARKQAPDPAWKELQEAATALSRANKQSAKTVQRLADAVIAKAKAVERKIEHERKIQEDEDDLIAVLLLAA